MHGTDGKFRRRAQAREAGISQPKAPSRTHTPPALPRKKKAEKPETGEAYDLVWMTGEGKACSPFSAGAPRAPRQMTDDLSLPMPMTRRGAGSDRTGPSPAHAAVAEPPHLGADHLVVPLVAVLLFKCGTGQERQECRQQNRTMASHNSWRGPAMRASLSFQAFAENRIQSPSARVASQVTPLRVGRSIGETACVDEERIWQHQWRASIVMYSRIRHGTGHCLPDKKDAAAQAVSERALGVDVRSIRAGDARRRWRRFRGRPSAQRGGQDQSCITSRRVLCK